MNPILRNTLLAASLLNTLPLYADNAAPTPLQITEVWTRPTGPGVGTGAGFLRIRNPGSHDERLLGAVSERAATVELHQLIEHDGVVGMRPLADGLVIPAGGEVRLAPSGTHLMLIDLRAPLLPGERVPLRLRFERAGELPVALHVEAAAPEAPRKPAAVVAGAGAANGHEHGHH
ncbi:MAG: copper chaperone PCu(A)C [Gammaproteobacteria bacterium]|nr:copper chaperone PCu(A)C [Gammaproteobacteria bacterium]